MEIVMILSTGSIGISALPGDQPELRAGAAAMGSLTPGTDAR
jgi:hypothetical protein